MYVETRNFQDTDTPLYTMSNGFLCINNTPVTQGGVKVSTNYAKYTENSPESEDQRRNDGGEYCGADVCRQWTYSLFLH